MLEAKKIYKSYLEGDTEHRLLVLSDVSFRIDEGNFAVITGMSGSGKSTLLHLLGALDRPDKGDIYFHDKSLNSLSEKSLAEFRNRHIGFMFQFHHLMPELTAIENVALPMMIRGVSHEKSISAAKKLLQQLDLQQRILHYPSELSGGEQQRVAVARALINNPDILLADEPTGNLDRKHTEELLQLLWQLNEKFSTTILLVTHDTSISKNIPFQYHLSDGHLVRVR